MTVTNVGNSAHTYQALGVSGDECAFNSVSAQLAVLVLDHQEQQQQLAHDEQQLARKDYRDAIDSEVHALREQADAAFRGAVVEGGISAASACFSFANAGCEAGRTTYSGATAKGLGDAARPLGALVSNTYGAADAKSAQGRQESAKEHIDDAREVLKNAEARDDKTLDWLSSMFDRDAATTTAILSNKA